MKQAESPACTKNKILIVAEAFQSLLCMFIKPSRYGKRASCQYLLSEARWAGISQETLFIVQAEDSVVTTATTKVTHSSSLLFYYALLSCR